MRIGPIEIRTDKQFLSALYELKSRRASGLILDLRWCPGGFLQEAVRIAKGLLTPELLISSRKDRNGVSPENYETEGLPVLDLPVVVLVNGATSGGGELIAAALQDHRRAIVAGERTVGKASVQQTLDRISLEGFSFKISKSLLIRPNGKNLQRRADSHLADDWGVRPDSGYWLPLSPALSNQLKEWWTWQALRPAGDNSALPTDDPEADPQLKTAFGILRKITQRGS
jgi:carboxyl-terminal processing protease